MSFNPEKKDLFSPNYYSTPGKFVLLISFNHTVIPLRKMVSRRMSREVATTILVEAGGVSNSAQFMPPPSFAGGLCRTTQPAIASVVHRASPIRH
jgi:hypothetical protein